VHQVPTGRHADLTLVQEGAPGTGGHRSIEIRVVQDDQCRIAAEFEMDALEVLTGEGTDAAAGTA